MTIAQLEYFYQMCRLGNISKAAKELHMTQPALSTSIKKLEKELGVKLIHTTTKGVEPTAAGLLLAEQCAPLLSSFEEVFQYARRLPMCNKQIVLGVTPACACILWPQIAKALDNSNEELEIELREDQKQKLFELLDKKQIDFLLIEDSLERIPNSYEQREVSKDCLVFCLHKDHPANQLLQGKKVLSLADIKDIPLCEYTTSNQKDCIFLQRFLDAGVEPKQVHYSKNQSVWLSFLVNKLAGGLITRRFLFTLGLEDSFCLYPLDIENITSETRLLWNKDRYLSQYDRTFIKIVRSVREL